MNGEGQHGATKAPFHIVGVGEVLWDLLPGGRQLGGAAANFAYHAGALGERGAVVSAVGDDADGRALLTRLDALGVDRRGVAIDSRHPTGTVTVRVADDGQPDFTIHEGVAWDHLRADAAAMAVVSRAHAICFGSLAQRAADSREAIAALLAAAPREALRICDVNLRQHYFAAAILQASLEAADILKLNDGELPVLAGLFGIDGDETERLDALRRRFGLRMVALTRGAQGSRLLAEGEESDLAGAPVRVVDTVGAGDSFTATLTVGLLRGRPLAEVHAHASRVAAYVCTQPGATPDLPEALRRG